MTVYSRDTNPDTDFALPGYAIVGEVVASSKVVYHVAITRVHSRFQFGQQVPIWDNAGQAGALIVGSRTLDRYLDRRSGNWEDDVYLFSPDILGFTRHLGDDGAKKIKHFLDELDDAKIETGFIVFPHYQVKPYKFLKRRRQGHFIRTSCVGLVFECYKKAGITLVDLEHDEHPELSLEEFRKSSAITDRKREQCGLTGEGPWTPVLLPGYVFHALDRDEAEIQIPYKAKRGDEAWP